MPFTFFSSSSLLFLCIYRFQSFANYCRKRYIPFSFFFSFFIDSFQDNFYVFLFLLQGCARTLFILLGQQSSYLFVASFTHSLAFLQLQLETKPRKQFVERKLNRIFLLSCNINYLTKKKERKRERRIDFYFTRCKSNSLLVFFSLFLTNKCNRGKKYVDFVLSL